MDRISSIDGGWTLLPLQPLINRPLHGHSAAIHLYENRWTSKHHGKSEQSDCMGSFTKVYIWQSCQESFKYHWMADRYRYRWVSFSSRSKKYQACFKILRWICELVCKLEIVWHRKRFKNTRQQTPHRNFNIST